MRKKERGTVFKAPEGAEAALFFYEGQYLFEHGGDGSVKSKLVSPAAVRQAFSNEPVDSGWLPEGVLRWGAGSRGVWMVRFHKPAVRTLLFDNGSKRPRKIKVPTPALVWLAQGHSYFIFAMKGRTCNPSNPLFHAPLANVNSSGLICFGSNAHPDCAKHFDEVWRTFWAAPFNDDHSNGKSVAHRENVNRQLRALAKQKATVYPERDLVRVGRTLDQVVDSLAKRGGDSESLYERDFYRGGDGELFDEEEDLDG